MSTFEIENKVQELRELKRMQEELSAEIEAIQDTIKQHMDNTGMDTLLGMDYKITWKAVTTSRLDSTALKKALPEIVAQYTKTTTSRRFVIA